MSTICFIFLTKTKTIDTLIPMLLMRKMKKSCDGYGNDAGVDEEEDGEKGVGNNGKTT